MLILFCKTGKQVEVAKLLLEEGCSAGACNAHTHSTPLHVAVKRRSVELVALLLEYGADPLFADKVGRQFLVALSLFSVLVALWHDIGAHTLALVAPALVRL